MPRAQEWRKYKLERSDMNIDDVDEAQRLIDKMNENLPIFARPNSALVKILRKKGVNADRYKPLEIHSVLYMGNEAGISCDITPKGQTQDAFICSLTQLEVMGDDDLAQEMKAYQQKRLKSLARHGANIPISFTLNPRKKN
jgi:hypothetical protein